MKPDKPDGGGIVIELAPRAMKPLDPTLPIDELVRRVLHNIRAFDKAGWAAGRTRLRDCERACPPDRLYRVLMHDPRVADPELVLGVVVGYGSTPMVHVLGVADGPGSSDCPIAVPVEALEDFTRHATLTLARGRRDGRTDLSVFDRTPR